MRVLTDPVETGAVTLCLPQDVQAEAFDWPVEFFRSESGGSGARCRNRTRWLAVAALLRSAERPLIIAGGGVLYS